MSNQIKAIILFDGDCRLCNDSVRFIENRDPKNHFTYISLKSKEAENLIKKNRMDIRGLDSVLLVQNDKILTHSTAALTIARDLSGLWPLLYGFIIIPKSIRDIIYKYVARRRHKWFNHIN